MANSRVTERTKPYSISTIRKKISPKVLRPSRNDNHFEDIIGNKDIIEQLKHTIELFQAGSDISILGYRYHPSYIFLGNPGVGKTLTVYAFAKEMNLPIVTINMERLIPDHSDAVFDGIIAFLKTIGKCVVLFKEIQFITSMETKEYFPIFTSILDIKEAFPDSFFFVTASTCFTFG